MSVSDYTMSPPILDYLPQIQEVAGQIPTDRFITRIEIERLNVDNLKILFYYTFSRDLEEEDYFLFELLFGVVGRAMIDIPDNAVVIASGDSPSKVVALINLFWRIDTDTYKYEYDEKVYDPRGRYDEKIGDFPSTIVHHEATKRIKFVTFPISGLQDKEFPRDRVPIYLKGVLESNNVDYSGSPTFYDLDYMESGKSHRELLLGLQLLNPNISLWSLDISEYIESASFRKEHHIDEGVNIFDTIISAESFGSRCVPKYTNPDEPIPSINMRACNLIVIMTYLKALDQLGKAVELPYKGHRCFVQNRNATYCIDGQNFYDLVYYDLGDNEFKSIRGYVRTRKSGGYHIKVIIPDVYEFPELDIPDGVIIKVTRIPNHEIYGPKKFDHSKVRRKARGIATLVNGFRVEAVRGDYVYRIGNDKVEQDFVVNFEPL